METACGYLTEDQGKAWFSSNEQKWSKRITKLAQEYPDQVKITVPPETNGGCINAIFPAKWLRINPPKKINLTDEQRAARAERMRKLHQDQQTEDEDNADEMEEEDFA